MWSASSIGTYYPTSVKEENDVGYIELSWENDNDYNYFRYQRDGEKDEKWTITEGNSAVIPYHKGLNTYYVQSSWDGDIWSESAVTYYRCITGPQLKVIVESLEFNEEDVYNDGNLALRVSENETDEEHLSYTWDNTGYNWLRFRINDEPWYFVDSHTKGTLLKLIEGSKEDAVFQIKGSNDGVNWTERLTINDKNNKYNEKYIDREGWVISSGFSVYYPYLVAFFTPAKGTINYTTPRELSTEDLQVSFGVDISAAYETEKGNSFGFNIRYLYSPTHKNDPYTSTSLEFVYSRLIVRTPKYNTFQLWLNTGLGPSLCIFQKTGSIGISLSLGLEARFTFSNNLVLTVSYGNTVIIEPNINNKDQLTLGTTFYTTLPVRIGLSYSFKEVKD